MPSLGYLTQPQVLPLDNKTITHSIYGNHSIHTIRNKKSSDVNAYLGIKYASIPARFRTAVPTQFTDSLSSLKARTYGPRCPQPVDYPRELRNHLYTGIEASSGTPVDEFECLTLNIYKPSHHDTSGDVHCVNSLPVLVWIHGGGWTVGDGNSEYDGSFLVRHSIAVNKPFIFVGINYRLGFYGFLTSKELRAEEAFATNVSSGQQKKPWSNQGLCDQRLAMLWVQQNISQFGGDPSRVTLAGESAGAWCVMAHLQADVPLFQRAIVMSCPKVAVSSFEDAQLKFDELVRCSGCNVDATAEEKLHALRCMSYQELEIALNGQFVRPITEPQLFGCDLGGLDFPAASNKETSFPSWIQGIVVGTTKDECALWISTNDEILTNDKTYVGRVEDAVHQAVPQSSLSQQILSAYEISSENILPDAFSAITAVQKLASDALFNTIPQIVAENSSCTPTSIYSFLQTDDYENSPFKGGSYHSLDNVYFCRLPSVTDQAFGATRETLATVDAFSAAMLTFIEGEMPWPVYNSKLKEENGSVFMFDADKSRLEQREQTQLQTDFTRWVPFIATKQHEAMFTAAGRRLLGLARKF